MRITDKITLAILAAGIGLPAIAQNKPSKPVHIKIIKIIDGDTTIIEKNVNEDEVHEFKDEMDGLRGKNMKGMIDRQKLHESTEAKAEFFYFNDSLPGHFRIMKKSMIIDPDSITPGMMFHFYDSALPPGFPGNMEMMMKDFNFMMDTMFMKEFPEMKEAENMMYNDSIIKNFGKQIGYSFSISDDSGHVVVRQFGPEGKKVIVKKLEGEPGEELSEDVIIRSEDGKTVTRVIVRTTVKIEDVEKTADEKNTSRKEKNDLKLEGLKFYPNPNDGRFTIDFEAEGKQPVILTITDMKGREVYREEVKANGKHSSQVDLGREGKGTYILNLRQGKRSTTKKIVIE